MRFSVRAIDQHQQLMALRLEAGSAQDARAQIEARQLTVLSIRALSGWRFLDGKSSSSGAFDLALFSQELHALIIAGLSIVEALEVMLERSNSESSKSIFQRLLIQLREGQRFSVALERYDHVFTPLFIGVIHASEGTSDLPQALERFISYEMQVRTLRQKIVSAAIYPSILLGVGGSVALFLLGYVVPRFAGVYQNSGRALPIASEVLLAWGIFATQYAELVALALVSAIGVSAWAMRRSLRHGGWRKTLKWLPGMANRLIIVELSRLYLTLGMLLEGGIPISKAMQLSGAVLSPEKALSLRSATLLVSQGVSLSRAFELNGLSTSIASRLLSVGERTGQLGVMLTRTASFYDRETNQSIERFTKGFEPVLMTVIGIVIGLIVVLLYMPIFDLAGNFQ